MKLNRLVRFAATALTVGLGVPVAANWQAGSDRMGWSTALADVVVPKGRPSPVAAIIASPAFVVIFLLVAGAAAGIWIDTAVRALDQRRATKRWWEGLQSFSIQSFSCLAAGIKQND